MITLILATFLTATPAAQIQTCVWPNRCASSAVIAARPITTCVWPNVCG